MRRRRRQCREDRTTLVIQRFFGACEAEYGASTDVAAAEGECGIMTTIINRFEAENPDIRVVENIVFWPGYDQLTAQLASNDAPDLVTMHGSVIADYQARGLLDPLDADLAAAGITVGPADRRRPQRGHLDNHLWGMPIDSWAPLWHINMNLFRQAGLVRDGRPILPHSPEELFAQAEQFRRRTGKPYLVQGTANEYAAFTRNFYTFVMQQGGRLYSDERHANFRTPEARRALAAVQDDRRAQPDHQEPGLQRRDRRLPQRPGRRLPGRDLDGRRFRRGIAPAGPAPVRRLCGRALSPALSGAQRDLRRQPYLCDAERPAADAGRA